MPPYFLPFAVLALTAPLPGAGVWPVTLMFLAALGFLAARPPLSLLIRCSSGSRALFRAPLPPGSHAAASRGVRRPARSAEQPPDWQP